MRALLLIILLMVGACNYGPGAEIVCYSAGKEIYRGVSADIVNYSSGYVSFRDAKDLRYRLIQADCVIVAK